MTVGVLTLPWDLHLPQGGQQSVKFLLKNADGITPYPIVGRDFEYVVRADPTDSGIALVSVTTSLNAQGQLTVNTTKSSVVLNLLHAATATLAPGTYYHAFWMDPGQPSAFNWFAGKFFVDPASQP